MYMYPINIKREPQQIWYEREVQLTDEVLTLSKLRKLVSEDETFRIIETEKGEKTLYIAGSRFETKEEVAERVKREEAYMDGYRKFHSKK